MLGYCETIHMRTRAQQYCCWDERPFGHNRHGPKSGEGLLWGAESPLGPHLTQCGLGRGIPLYQVAAWPIQLFGHNCRNATLLRVGIPLRTIFIPSLIVKTFRVRTHWVIARTNSQVNNVLKLSGKHSKIVGNLHVNFTIQVYSPTKILLPYFIQFLNSHIFAFAILR